MDATDLQAVFVYGSARPGEYNYWMKEAVLDVVKNVTIAGRMTHNGVYPYLSVDPQYTDAVWGDVLIMDRDHELYAAFEQMEVGAGYGVTPVVVHSIGHGIDFETIAYTIPADDHRMRRYPVVVGGDWPRFRRLTGLR